jgi:ectoine hydroxylase-related dioxygenase (phytanoyl-CoA dioxygenase family)
MLTGRQQEAFFDTGYVVLPGVFSRDELREMREAFERLASAAAGLGQTGMHRGSQFVLSPTAGGGIRIDRVVWCGAAEPVLSAFGKDPRLVGPAAELLGSPEMHQLINQAHFKLPGDGVEFPWHQDSFHRRHGTGEWHDANGRGSYVQTMIAVDDMTVDNGPLEFIPGSCATGHLEPPAGETGWLPERLDPASAVAVTLEAGGLLLFGPYTWHRSLPNRSDRPRRAFVNGFAYPGANSRLYPGEGAGRLVRWEP